MWPGACCVVTRTSHLPGVTTMRSATSVGVQVGFVLITSTMIVIIMLTIIIIIMMMMMMRNFCRCSGRVFGFFFLNIAKIATTTIMMLKNITIVLINFCRCSGRFCSYYNNDSDNYADNYDDDDDELLSVFRQAFLLLQQQ